MGRNGEKKIIMGATTEEKFIEIMIGYSQGLERGSEFR